MIMTRPRVHVIYEYGNNSRPFSTSFIRLIRPLTHPWVHTHLDVTFGPGLSERPTDLVILDRLWRPDVSMELVTDLVKRVRQRGARFLYSLDDNFFDLEVSENRDYPPKGYLSIVTYLLSQADGVLTSTSSLRERLLEYNPHVQVIPNALDERLLVGRYLADSDQLGQLRKIVIGYMGTFTHDADLQMVLPALQAVARRHPGQIEFQMIGVTGNKSMKKKLQDLPIRYVSQRLEEYEYPLFMLWFTGHIRWDIAIAPLCDTPFTRCKSDIKFLDYSALSAAGIYSRVTAYETSVRHMETGWLSESFPEAWEEALETLITNHKKRLQIAQDAMRYLYTERILTYCAGNWPDAITTTPLNLK